MKQKAIVNGVLTEVEVDDAVVAQAKQEDRLQEIEALKAQLASSDYKAIKFAEGWLTADEYAPIKAMRQELRNRINELEDEGAE